MQLSKIQRIFIYTLVFCALLLLIFPLTTSAQTVNIPDANLRAAITEALGKAPNARITAGEMARLTRLEARNMEIRDLTGLETATNLEDLRLLHNLISDISPLAGLTKAHRIWVGHNVVSDLSPLKDLINLTSLGLEHNLISDLSPLESLINLRDLNLSHNAISDLSPVKGLIKLQWIGMTENPLADLSPLAGLSNLQSYHSWGTPIVNLSALAKLPKLREINICGGEISDLSPLAGATSLKELYLVNNDISDISPLASLKSLTRLSLKHNEVTDVSPLASLSNLTWIELDDNEILDFSPLDVFPESVAIIRHTNPGFTQNVPKIEGPWLWVIAPTEGMSGSKAAASGKDFLAQISGGTVTEVNIATHGAIEGDAVGDKVWTLGKISRRGGNNINGLINSIALGTGNIDHHVAYGSVNLDSPREQNTRMFVGGSDAVKVWINGKLVHNNATGRNADDYQENFAVTLKEGTNVLLVAVYEGEGWWSGFFGFDTGTAYAVWTQSPPIPLAPSRVADIDEDGSVSILDLILVARDLERIKPSNPRTDVNGDGKINILDLTFVAKSMDEAAGATAPSAFAVDDPVSPALIQTWIAQAQIETDGSIAFQQGIANLQRLLASFIPEKTALLANYPNPFNPETWIPYQLATAGDVQIRIYATNGILIRTLDMGHQPAGIYHQQSRAAYWDGKNEVGESVASGVYFYTLTAGNFTRTRKMLIAK